MATVPSPNTLNQDIDYIVKDFNSTVDALITFATVNFGANTSANRLWTDFNTDSFSRNWLEIVAFVADVFFFYFDNQATQSYLQTATLQSAIEDIARQFGFTPASAASASGIATFTVTGSGTIPRGFRVQSSNGEVFYVTNNIIAVSAGEVSGTVLQGIITTNSFVAQGVQSEEFNLTGPNVVVDLTNINPADISPIVTVSGNSYTLVDSLILQNGTDTPVVTDSLGEVIGGGGRAFTLGTRANGTPFVTFGDGVFGRLLTSGESVTVTYRVGGGSAGNIDKQTLNTLVDTNAIVSSVTNNTAFSGGADPQSIDQLRALIPASLRTLERAVSTSDYGDILVANFTEVFAANAEINTSTAGVDLNIYVVPQGNGITNITDNPVLLNTLTNFIDIRKTVTVQFQILDAFGIDTLITLEVFISNTASRNSVSLAIQTAIQNFFSLTTGGPNSTGVGFQTEILLKDINSVVETVAGIDRFEIRKLTYRPRVQQNIIGLLTTYNVSEVTIYPNVEQIEWMVAASGPVSPSPSALTFDNTGLVGFTYNSGTGVITYSFPVDLTNVAPSNNFIDGALNSFAIFAVDALANTVTISTGQTVNNTVTTHVHGSIQNGSVSNESYVVFKKLKQSATNLSVNSVTDNNLDLSVINGIGAAIAPRILLDNSNVFIPDQYSTGIYYLVDSLGNIWEITDNDSNTLTTSVSAVNDASVTHVASGAYAIVRKMTNGQVVFNGEVFNVEYNNGNTMFSIGAQFNQIGTIGDNFDISVKQSNTGNLGLSLDLLAYNPTSQEVTLNGAPNLEGVNLKSIIIDSSGQLFNISAIDNATQFSVSYPDSNKDTDFILPGSGIGQQVAEGFKVTQAGTYAVVTLFLKKQGNIVGNLTANIVADDGTGLPDLTHVLAVSKSVPISSLSTSYSDITFGYNVPPTLATATQYHIVLSGDATYNANEQSGVKSFDNTGLVGFTYNPSNGIVTYASFVDLSNVEPGEFFRDGAGALFQILSVNGSANQLTLDTGLTVNNTVATSNDGAVFIYNQVLIGIDSSAPTYTNGQFSRYDGTNWSNSTQGPHPSGTLQVACFTVQGTKSITLDSNLTPVLGTGATVSRRYYDDNNEISFVLGISNGVDTFASDVQPTGLGTVASVPNSKVDTFVFRTSPYSDDIVNLRANEIPQLQLSDLTINVFGGVQ